MSAAATTLRAARVSASMVSCKRTCLAVRLESNNPKALVRAREREITLIILASEDDHLNRFTSNC